MSILQTQLQFQPPTTSHEKFNKEDDDECSENEASRKQYEHQLQYLTLRNKSELSLVREKYEKQVKY